MAHPTVLGDRREMSDLAIYSPGRDGRFEVRPSSCRIYKIGPFIATDYDRDTIWGDGDFVQWPESSGGLKVGAEASSVKPQR